MGAKKRYYSLRAYASYLRRYKYRFLLVVLVFALSDVLIAIAPVLIGKLVSALAANPLDRSDVYWQTGVLGAISITHHLTWHAAEVLYWRLIVKPNHEFGNILFRKVIERPYPYFVGKFTGKIGSYVSDLSREYIGFVANVCYNYLNMLIKLPTIALIMFSVNWYTGSIFLLSTLVMILVGRKTVQPAMRKEKIVTDKSSSLNGYIIDVISNFVSVKAFRKTQAEADYVRRQRETVIDASKQAYIRNVFFWASLGFIVRVVVWPGTIALNVWLFLNGHLSLAQITTFTTALVIFSDYVWGVVWNVQMFNLTLARLEESYRYLFGTRNVVREYYESSGQSGGVSKLTLDRALELRNLDFSYPDDKQKVILQNINLRLEKQEKIGVVGHSGSGKTTLIKLLLGYYGVPEANCLLDGQAIDNRQLVHLISYVPQDTSLFHRTIAQNIAYGTEERPAQVVIEQAAKRAHAHEFITQTPKGYKTMVGEKGIKLSMGQRQRIAIARAFLDNKPLLILDEATSALDSESEVLVQQALEDLWSDKTVIAIAHRLSTLRHMDRIVVMDKGRIVESGTHQELLKKRGQYYRLWQHQHGGLIGD